MPLTTDETVARDLRASMHVREGVPVGNTWGAFKAAMLILGVQDEDRIASLEYGISVFGLGRIQREDAAEGVEIREVKR